MAIVISTDFGGWDESILKLLLEIHQYLRNRMSEKFVSLRSTSVHFRNNTFFLRKVVETHCDMPYQKYCKIVVSKEFCLHYVTLPLKGQLPVSGICRAVRILHSKTLFNPKVLFSSIQSDISLRADFTCHCE